MALSLEIAGCASSRCYRARVVDDWVQRLSDGRLVYSIALERNNSIDTIHVTGPEMILMGLNGRIKPGDNLDIENPPRHVVYWSHLERVE